MEIKAQYQDTANSSVKDMKFLRPAFCVQKFVIHDTLWLAFSQNLKSAHPKHAIGPAQMSNKLLR